MAYNVTGTAGNDVLNQQSDTGPGTIVGLAGDDCIFQGTGSAQIFGNSGNDTVVLQAGNTGTVNGGTENDSVFAAGNSGAMQLAGNEGADTVNTSASSAAQTIVGGDNSGDGADTILAGGGADLVFGNGGNDTIEAAGGANTVYSGFGDDSIRASAAGLYFGNQGADRINLNPSPAGATVVGGNDSADGGDFVDGSIQNDLVFGNGGNDTLNTALGADTAIGGFGNDDANLPGGGLFFGNEGNDSVIGNANPPTTVFGGLGNDSIRFSLFNSQNLFVGGEGADTIVEGNVGERATIYGGVDSTAGGGADGADSIAGRFGNLDLIFGGGGNDTIQGDDGIGISIDTIAGGSGNDVFAYVTAGDDGNNAAGGGPLEQVTDVDWSVDRFDTATQVTFATNTGAGTGADLNASANNAIAAAFALGGGGATVAAAQFTFAGRTYLAINQDGVLNAFLDTGDLLLDITGVTGAIATSNFI